MIFADISNDFLWIYKSIYKTDSFIVNGADLEHAKNNISWWMMLFWSIYIFKTPKIEAIILNNHYWESVS